MKTVVITGANTGIGLATAKKFVEDGHHVVLACRNLDKAQKAKAEISTKGHGQIDIVELDLNDLNQVKSAAQTLKEKYSQIDILVNNAGLMTPKLEEKANGFEKQIGVNYLGHFVWTMQLLPLLQNAPSGRIIHLASMMHVLGKIDTHQFKFDSVKKYNGVLSYGNSKLANLLFSHALAEKLRGTSIISNAIHPGGVDSEIYRELPNYQYRALKLFLISPNKPANLIHQIALSPEWSKKTGQYKSLQTPAFQSAHAKNRSLAQRLFDETEQLLKEYL